MDQTVLVSLIAVILNLPSRRKSWYVTACLGLTDSSTARHKLCICCRGGGDCVVS